MSKYKLIASTGAAALLVAFSFAIAADKEDATKEPAQPTTKESAEKKKETPADLLEAMAEELNVKPDEQTPEGLQKAFRAAFARILESADKVIAHADATKAQKSEAMEFKISILGQGMAFKVPGYDKRLEELNAELAKSDPKGMLHKLSSKMLIEGRHSGRMGLQETALPEVEQFLKTFPEEQAAGSMLFEIAMVAERKQKNAEAKKAYLLLKKHFGDHPAVERVDGAIRRLELVGKPMKLSGKTVAGKPLDITSLKGKVVLVDFWATWCGPCLAEMPHVKDAYKKYHDKGFEIIGVSLDDDAETLATFVKEEEMPWPQVFPEDEDKRGFDNPIAADYGISAIPAMFLVDQSGKVVSTAMTGSLLEEKLAELLGKASPKESPKAGE